MDNGEFADAHPGIVRVSWVDLDTITPAQQEPDTQERTDEPNPRNSALIFGLIAGFTTLLLALAAFVWRRRQKENDDSNSQQTPDVENSASGEDGSTINPSDLVVSVPPSSAFDDQRTVDEEASGPAEL